MGDHRGPCRSGERLKIHRTKMGLSQKQLAALLGIDQSSLTGWERQEHYPSRRSLRLMEEFLAWTSIPQPPRRLAAAVRERDHQFLTGRLST